MAYVCLSHGLGDISTDPCSYSNPQSGLNSKIQSVVNAATAACMNKSGSLNLVITGPANATNRNDPFVPNPLNQGATSGDVSSNTPPVFSVIPSLPLIPSGETALVAPWATNQYAATVGPVAFGATKAPQTLVDMVNRFENSLGSPSTWPWWYWAIILAGGGFILIELFKKR